MSTRQRCDRQKRTTPRSEKVPQRWWEILEDRGEAEQPFAEYFRELEAKHDAAEMPWGGDSRLVEGWFEAGEVLEAVDDPRRWRCESSLERAWTWMCSHVLPAERTNPIVGQKDNETD